MCNIGRFADAGLGTNQIKCNMCGQLFTPRHNIEIKTEDEILLLQGVPCEQCLKYKDVEAIRRVVLEANSTLPKKEVRARIDEIIRDHMEQAYYGA